MTETPMPPVERANINGLDMAYWQAGPRRGVPILFCHGFPELAFSWRHQLAAMAAAGRWAIAPDQRGYGLTSRPEPVEAYDMSHLTGDLVALLDHLGVEKAVLCGHDWGGAVVWQAPLHHPDRVAGVIGLNTPFTPRAPADPIALLRARFGEDMYMVFFQKPLEADRFLAENVAKAMTFFMKRPLPGSGPTSAGLAGSAAGQGAAADPAASFALLKMLAAYDPAFDPREGFLTDQEMAFFVETFARTGFTGGINWYRNISRNWRLAEDLAEKVAVPSLMVMAEKDAVLPPSAADGMATYVPDLEKALIKDCGHWTQQEKPQEVNRVILGWMDRRFPQ